MALKTRKIDFLILGGGVSGLSAGFYLQKMLADKHDRVPKFKKNTIALLESSGRLGGWLHSTRTDEGSIHESGPRTMRPVGIVGRNSLNLAWLLGLGDEVLAVSRSHPAAKRRYLYAEKKLHELPSSLTAMLTRRRPFSRPLAFDLAREVLVKRSSAEDQSIYEFGVRRFGKEITSNLLDPLCRGVFAGRTTDLSVRSCFPQLYDFEQSRGSVVLGGLFGQASSDQTVGESDLVIRAKKEKWAVWTLRGGLQRLTDRLAQVVTVDGAQIHLQTPCRKIEFLPSPNGGNQKVARVHTADTVWETERLICSIPAEKLAQVLPVDLDPLSQHLRQIPTATVAVVNLEFEGSHLPAEGFGYLVPSHEPSDVLGVIFDSCGFPQHNRPGPDTTRMTCMMGGAWFQELFGDPDRVDPDQLASRALGALRSQMGLRAEPTYCQVSVSKDCIPNYRLNHHKILEKINVFIRENKLPLTLVGSSYKGVSVNDCIYYARRAAQDLVPDGQLTV